MNDGGTDWEVDTVRTFFHEELVNMIMHVPISRHGGTDFILWPQTNMVGIQPGQLTILIAVRAFSPNAPLLVVGPLQIEIPRRRIGRRYAQS
jgi:hypothetical protein